MPPKSVKGAAALSSSWLGDAYLVLYNVVQLGCWLAISVLIVHHLLSTNGDYRSVFAAVGGLLNIVQAATGLEVVHAAIGLVHTSALVNFVQYAGRSFALFAVSNSVPGAKEHVGCLMMVAAWSFFDVVRYTLYICTLLKRTPYSVLWARYTLFIGFYPVGFLGELLQIIYAIPVVSQSGLLSISMPNAANISFDFSYFLIFYSVIALPGFLYMYTHMLGQRKKHLLAKGKTS